MKVKAQTKEFIMMDVDAIAAGRKRAP